MFQFTTTNVINTDKDITTGLDLFVANAEDGDVPANLVVRRVQTFYQPNVEAIYEADPTEPEYATATVDLNTIEDAEDGDEYRLFILIGLSQGSQLSIYSNDLWFKSKPLTIDFVWKTDADTTADKIVKTVYKYQMNTYGVKLFDISNDGGVLTITARDEYQLFANVTVDKFDALALHQMGDYHNVIRALPEDHADYDGTNKIVQGKEGFGTYKFLLHNLRIPTDARTRAFGLNQDETPIMGELYTQFTIHYCVNRGPLGNNAVGDLVRSHTTHVFYVRSTIKDAFLEALGVIAPEDGIQVVPSE